jgi:hypothetical protein
MPNQYEFEFLIQNPNLFCFYDENFGFLRGFITVQTEDIDGEKRLTLSGTSIRGNMPDNIDAIIAVCEAFNEDMYAVTPLRHAELLLRKAGFVKLKEQILVRYKNG